MEVSAIIHSISDKASQAQFNPASMNHNAIGSNIGKICNTQEQWKKEGEWLYQLALKPVAESHRPRPSLRGALCDFILMVASTVRPPKLGTVARLNEQNVALPYSGESTIGPGHWHTFLPQDPLRFLAAEAVPMRVGDNQDDQSELAVTNRQAAHLLKEKKFLSQGPPHLPIGDLLKAAVEFLKNDGASKMSRQDLARCIQNSQGLYGGSEGECMSAWTQNAIIRNWMAQNIFGASIEHTIVKIAADHTPLFSFTGKHLLDSLNRVYAASTDPVVGDWIWTHVIVVEVPILRFKSQDVEHLKPHDFEWGLIHAGLRLDAIAKQEVSHIAIEDALVLGQSLLAQIKEGIEVDDYHQFFKLPSLIRYVQTHPYMMPNRIGKDIDDLESAALLDYATAHASYLKYNHPASNLQRLFNQYKTRRQLAQEIILDRCPGMKVETYLNLRFGDGTYCGKDPQQAFLPNINTMYQEQVIAIAHAYEIVDHLLMTAAWDQLPKKDRQFIHAAEIKQVSAQFSARDKIRGIAGASRPEMRKSLTLVLAGVELYSAHNAIGKEQVYSLLNPAERGGYDVNRVDRNRSYYKDFLTEDQLARLDQDFKLLIYLIGETLKTKSQEQTTMIEKIAFKHTEAFRQQLYDFGYSRTGLEEVSDFMLSLIPFYSCINDVKAGRAEQAALACGFDAVLLIPLFGQLSSSSIKIGQAVAKGGLIAARNVAAEMAAGHSLKATLVQGGRTLAQQMLVPAAQAISKKEITATGIAALRVVDPGIELSWTIGKAGIDRFIRHSSAMLDNLPRLKKILPHLQKAMPNLPQSLAPDAYTFGRIAGLTKDISVIKTEFVTPAGEAIFVRVDVKTGIRSGYKYTRSDDGALRAVTLTLPERLKNIREHGFGGKGGPNMAGQWAKIDKELASSSSAGTAQQTPIGAISQSGSASQALSQQEVMTARMSIANEVLTFVRETYYKTPKFKSSNKLRTRFGEPRELALERRQKAQDELSKSYESYKKYIDNPTQKLKTIKFGKAHNCGELSYLAAHALASQKMRAVQIDIASPAISGGAHAFAAVLPDNFRGNALGYNMGANMDQWSKDILIVDPWSNIACPAPEFNALFEEKMNQWHAKGKKILVNYKELGGGLEIPANRQEWIDIVKKGKKSIFYIAPDLRSQADSTQFFKGRLSQETSKFLP